MTLTDHTTLSTADIGSSQADKWLSGGNVGYFPADDGPFLLTDAP